MIKDDNPYLVEFNVRMGDPECQTILPLLENDLIEILDDCCQGELKKEEIKLNNKKSICIVLCSKGYPEKYEKNVQINGLDNLILKENQFIFHAGTKLAKNNILAYGGRVLNFVSLANNFKDSRNDNIYIYINGDFFLRSEAKISVMDSGYLLGDGVWEGIRLHKSKLVFIEDHLDRLYTSAQGISLNISYSKQEMDSFLNIYELPLEIVYDNNYNLVNDLKASITPEVYLIDENNKVHYQGLIDNWLGELGRKRQFVSEYYLKNAIESFINGEEIKIKKTQAIGCYIE